jgi:hypothetical protein
MNNDLWGSGMAGRVTLLTVARNVLSEVVIRVDNQSDVFVQLYSFSATTYMFSYRLTLDFIKIYKRKRQFETRQRLL